MERKRNSIYGGLILMGLLLAGTLAAQQMPQYSQYMMNKFLLNPAVAGAEGYTALNITAREQWIGMKDSPKTHAFSAQTRVLKNSFISRGPSVRKKKTRASRSGKVGLGGYVFHDVSGLVSRTGVKLTYAYHISFQRGQMSFGLSGSGYQFRISQEEIRTYDQDDILINNMNNRLFIPDADIGFYYSDPQFYAGLSVTQLFQAALKFGSTGDNNFKLLRHYYAMGGYNVEINDLMIFEPSVLVKTSQNWSFQMDLNAKMYFYEDYWGGISYRTGADAGAIILMGGFSIEQFYFGYAFDYTLSSIQRHSFGSHEFMLAVKLGDNARRYKWLERY